MINEEPETSISEPRVSNGFEKDIGTMTEPESLGPCEPGTAVKLQGIVWQETDKGKNREIILSKMGMIVIVEYQINKKSIVLIIFTNICKTFLIFT